MAYRVDFGSDTEVWSDEPRARRWDEDERGAPVTDEAYRRRLENAIRYEDYQTPDCRDRVKRARLAAELERFEREVAARRARKSAPRKTRCPARSARAWRPTAQPGWQVALFWGAIAAAVIGAMV